MAKINACIVIRQNVSAEIVQSAAVTAGQRTLSSITRQYVGKENTQTIAAVDNEHNLIEVTLKPHNYATAFDFPNIGDEAVLYIDESKNKVYRWSSSELRYYCVGSDYEDIKIIYGGKASDG